MRVYYMSLIGRKPALLRMLKKSLQGYAYEFAQSAQPLEYSCIF